MSIYVIVTRDFTSRAQQRVNTLSGLVALVSNTILCYILIPRFGINGAAMATAVSYAAGSAFLISVFLKVSRLPLSDLIVPQENDVRYFVEVLKKLAKKLPGGASPTP